MKIKEIPSSLKSDVVQWLSVAVFIDMLALAMVVPLLPVRMTELGVRPSLIGLIRSVYSAAQIVGGMALAVASDRGLISRRGVLIVSFAGAALSYGIVGFANSVPLLIFSRVVVGLAKQTMTTSSVLIAVHTEPSNRASAFGKLGTASSIGWLVGQYIGGRLSARVHVSAPALAAVMLYAIDIVLVLAMIPSSSDAPPKLGQPPCSKRNKHQSLTCCKCMDGLKNTLGTVAADKKVRRILGVQACIDLVSFGFYAMVAPYEQAAFAFSVEDLGSLGTARAAVALFLKALVAGPIINRLGEGKALIYSMFLRALTYGAQGLVGGVRFYVIAVMPIGSLSSLISDVGMKSLLTNAADSTTAGTTLAAVDVVHSICGVVAPTIGGLVLEFGGPGNYPWSACAAHTALLLLVSLALAGKEKAKQG